jgi:hypothetical protein
MYENGTGVSKNQSEALKWVQKAAEQGYATSQVRLGNMYRFGTGVPKNSIEAVKWFRKAAEQGLSWGQVCLASCYAEGTGVPQDFVEAYAWGSVFKAMDTTGNASWDMQRPWVERHLSPQGLERAQARGTQLYEEIRARQKKK